jgi:hypothetical protein
MAARAERSRPGPDRCGGSAAARQAKDGDDENPGCVVEALSDRERDLFLHPNWGAPNIRITDNSI